MDPGIFPANLSGLRASVADLRERVGRAAFGNPGTALYVHSASGNDANDGRSWTTAKRTLLAAYDALPASGGTLYVADDTLVGGEVEGQGLWMMGPGDPRWNNGSVPLGWRKAKALRIVGVGSIVGRLIRQPVAKLIGGFGAWGRDPNKPAFWISSNHGMPFLAENLIADAGDLHRAVCLGVPSDRSPVETYVANLTFRFCRFGVSSGSAADLGRGPTVEVEHAFWTYFEDCSFGALGLDATEDNAALGLTAEERGAAVAAVIRGNASAGLSFRRCTTDHGGIVYTLGSTSGSLYVDDLILEGDFVNPATPAVRINNSGPILIADLRGVLQADVATTSQATVTIRPVTATPEAVTCSNVDRVDGPATIVSRYPARRRGVQSMAAMGAVGFDGRAIVGAHDGARRLGAIGVNRFANIVAAPPATTSAFRIESGVADPHGGTGAFRAVALLTGRQDLFLRRVTLPLAVGDRLMVGAWVRAPGGADGEIEPALLISSSDTRNRFEGGSTYAMAAPRQDGDGQWWWLSTYGIVETVVESPVEIPIGFHSDRTFEFYRPTAYHVPAAAMGRNEFAEFAMHWQPAPLGAPAGELIAPQRIGMRDDVTGEWRYLRISNGQVVIE